MVIIITDIWIPRLPAFVGHMPYAFSRLLPVVTQTVGCSDITCPPPPAARTTHYLPAHLHISAVLLPPFVYSPCHFCGDIVGPLRWFLFIEGCSGSPTVCAVPHPTPLPTVRPPYHYHIPSSPTLPYYHSAFVPVVVATIHAHTHAVLFPHLRSG